MNRCHAETGIANSASCTDFGNLLSIRMSKYHHENVEKLFERHFELEQSETKAQATLLTILSLTQITELKLLLDIGRNGHDFYDFVLTLLLASICLEIFIGIVIIYIGNLNYFHATDRTGHRRRDVTSVFSLPAVMTSSTTSGYATMKGRQSSSGDCDPVTGSPVQSHGITGIVSCDSPPIERHHVTSIERLDASIEMALIKMADIEQKTSQVSSYVRVLEEALRKSPGSADLREELARAKSSLSAAGREIYDTEVKRRADEAQKEQTLVIQRREEEYEALEAFRRICYWKQIATYALYVVMIMNIFVTTFGISGGNSSGGGSRVFVTRPHHVHSHVVVPLPLSPRSASSAFNTTTDDDH